MKCNNGFGGSRYSHTTLHIFIYLVVIVDYILAISVTNFDKEFPTKKDYSLKNITASKIIEEKEYSTVYKISCNGQPLAKKDTTVYSDSGLMSVLNEIHMMKDNPHPNIIKFDYAFRQGNTVSILMEWADGGTVENMIEQNIGPLPYEKVMEYGSQLADAVAYLHGRHIAHLDIKPANVLIHEGKVKLADFGVAKKYAGDETIVEHVGDPKYKGPESLYYLWGDGGKLSTDKIYVDKVDIWCMGATIYEMIIGKVGYFDDFFVPTRDEHEEWRKEHTQENQMFPYPLEQEEFERGYADSKAENIEILMPMPSTIPKESVLKSLAYKMTKHHPKDRPTAAEVKYMFSEKQMYRKTSKIPRPSKITPPRRGIKK